MTKDYKALYEALIEDIRKHLTIDICEICVGVTAPCTVDCDLECDTCASGCRCRECINGNNWKWRGDNEPNRKDD